MRNIHKKIQTLSNIAIIIAALLFGGVLVNRYFFSASAPKPVAVAESEFREKFRNGDIRVSAFDISNVSYAIDPTDSTLATVTMDVHIEAIVDGTEKNGDFTLTHKVKQGWQAYESAFS